MYEVAKAGRRVGPVRVVRHDRAPRRRLRTADHPTVAAFQSLFLKRRQLHGLDNDRGLRSLRIRFGDPHALGGELENLQDVRGQAGIEPLGNLRFPVVGEAEANLVRIDVLCLAQGVGARDFG